MATKASRIALAGSNISSTGEVDADLLDNIDSAAFLSLDGNGRLGIGETSALGKLHVKDGDAGSITTNGAHDTVIIEGSGNTGINIFSPNTSYQYLAFGDTEGSNSGYVRYQHSNNQMVLRAGATDTVYINDGKVGIGTNSPDRALTIEGSDFPSSTIRLKRTGGGANNDAGLQFESAAGANAGAGMGGIWFQNSLDGNAYALIRARTDDVTGTSGRLDFMTGTSSVSNSTTPRMTIKGDGSVGIGTTSPHANLHVQGTTGNNTGTSEINLWVNDDYGRSKFNLVATDDGTTVGKLQITTESTVPANPELVTILNNGNVGINKSNPSATLDIANNSVSQTTLNVSPPGSGDQPVALINRGYGSHKGSGLKISGANYTNGSNANSAFLDLSAGSYSGSGTRYIHAYDNSGTDFVVQGDGKVGIGTSSPATALDVNGIIKIGNASTSASAAGAGAIKYDGTLRFSDGNDWKAISVSINDGSTVNKAFDDLSEVAGLYSSDTQLYTTVQGYESSTLQYTVDFTDAANPKYQATNSNSGVYDTNGSFTGCSQGTGTGWTVWDAARYCMRGSARLCSLTELDNNVVAGTGCSHDNRAIWTYTTNGSGNFYRGAGINSSSTNEGYVAGTNTSPTGYTTNEIGIRCCGTGASGGALWEI